MNSSHKKRIVLGLLFIGILVALRFSGLGNYINFDSFKQNRAFLLHFVTTHYIQSVTIFILLYILSVAFSLPIAAALTFSAGFLFGLLPAVVYSNIGATIGSIISFILVRYFFGNLVQQRYQKKLLRFNRMIDEYGSSFLLITRFVAVIPLVLINTLAGLTRISLWTFTWTTIIGIIPGAFVYAFAGNQLETINSFRDIFSLNVLLAFGLLGLLGLLPLLFKRFFNKKRK